MSKSKRASDVGREAWTLLFGLLSERPVLEALAEEFDISPSVVSLLQILQPTAGVPMRTLAKHLRCHDSNVTGLVDKLEARKLVHRRDDPADRRVNLIALTAKGIELRERILTRLYDPPAFIENLNADDKKTLRDVLVRARVAFGIEPIDAGSSRRVVRKTVTSL